MDLRLNHISSRLFFKRARMAGAGMFAAFIAVLLLSGGMPLHAQTVSGTVTGTITDTSGAAIPGVSITVTNANTEGIRKSTTNGAGIFSVPALPPGPYTVSAEAKGFEKANSSINLAVGQTLNVNFQLTVGSTNQVVQVFANESLGLETQDHELSTVTDAKTLENLPEYAGYRGATFYAQTATVGVQPMEQQGASGMSSNVTQYNEQSNSLLIGGQGYWTTTYLQDGVVDMAYFDQTATVQPPPEATEQVEVIRNDANARYDGANVMSVVSKSGTTSFHGRVYDEVENDIFNARGYNAGPLKETRFNQFGANAGWFVPFTHKKVFFFVDYQGYRDVAAAFLQVLVPTQAERNGDFSADLVANSETKQAATKIYDPTTYNPANGIDTTGAGPNVLSQFDYNGQPNVMDPGLISPLATTILNMTYPYPNNANTSKGDNYGSVNSRTLFKHDDYLFRGDYNISEKDHLYGAYNTNNPQIVRPEDWDNGPNSAPGNPLVDTSEHNQLFGTDIYVEESHVISPSLVNTARVGYSRSVTGQQFNNVNNGTNYFTQLGLTGLNPPPQLWGTPAIYPGGYKHPTSKPLAATQNMYEYSDEVNWVHGKHSIFFGGEYDWVGYNAFWYSGNPNGGLNTNGEYTYNGSSAAAWQRPGQWVLGSVKMPYANELADFLLGYFSSTAADTTSKVGYFHQNNIMPYFQDNWHIRKNLTLNLGLRYDNYSPPAERFGHAGVLNPVTGAYNPVPYNWNKYNFSPRVGFAYALNDKTSIHGGAGIYYFQFSYFDLQDMMDDPLYNTTLNSVQTQTNPVIWPDSSAGPNPNTGAAPGEQEFLTLEDAEAEWAAMPAPSGTFPGDAISFAQKMPTSYSEEWNLAVQRTFGRDWLLTLDYTGSADHHLYTWSNINLAALPGPGDVNPTSTADIQSRRPFQSIQGNIQQSHKWGNSNYNGMEVQLQKRFSNGFQLNTNFVWQKSMDYQDDDRHTTGQAGLHPQVDYGRSDFDQPYVYKLSGIYELPFGQGKPFLHGGDWWQKELGGWRLSGLLTVNGGFPFGIVADDTSNTGGGITMRAQQTCDGNHLNHRSFNEFFDTSCYSEPADNTFGNERRNSLTGPRNTNVDLSVFKEFPIHENLTFQWRTDAYSVFNHPLPQQPENTLTDTTFGEVTGWGGARILQLTAKILW